MGCHFYYVEENVDSNTALVSKRMGSHMFALRTYLALCGVLCLTFTKAERFAQSLPRIAIPHSLPLATTRLKALI